ncbi:MAG: NADP-dependent malic enzyme [Chloroflexi bacterium]|nr:MAG: NADP-dependent malic enzyme [Chloroflexota bacterium]
MAFTKQDVLDYHSKGRPGKIEVVATKPLTTQHHLTLAYSPGVAEAVLEVADNPLSVFDYTAKANLVAVVSNGSAILGLGNRGALAAKPVMEGKGVLFKRFADVDVFDIEVNADTVEEMIAVCRAIAPTFGGINLEDIKAPECFEIERRLKEELDIPVFHDDQHGTAIISGAALLNAAEIVDKKLEDMRVVISGAGASAIATGEFYISLGIKREHILMVDSRGVIYKGREAGLNQYKAQFANETDARTLEDAVKGADVFLGLSVPDVLTQDMVKTMAKDPLIFALANPDPEIKPELAFEVRPDAIVATGRSDYPNQVNNVLGFPFIFRGALDVSAKSINEEMKMAAAKALAALAKEDVPDSVLTAYGLTSLKFGREYLIPTALDSRVLLWVAPAVAQAAIDTGVARRGRDINEYRNVLIRRQGVGQQVRNNIISRAKLGTKKRVVFAEGEEPQIIRAAAIVQDEGIGTPILLGRPDRIHAIIKELGLNLDPEIHNTNNREERLRYHTAYYQLRQRKGVNDARAWIHLRDPNVFGLMMVKNGDADTFLSGLTYEYPDVIRPALQIFHTRPGTKRASGVYLMIIKGRVYLFTDATVNIDPDAETLAEIAILASDFAKSLGNTLEIDPKVAMLSFSNFGSAPHPFSNKVAQAVEIVQKRRPDVKIDGEMQADTAVVAEIVDERYPFSRVKDANVLVFPDLSSANIAYKLLARLTDADAIGPILVGIGAPVHVLQAGDEVEDIVAMTAVAVVDAQNRDQ